MPTTNTKSRAKLAKPVPVSPVRPQDTAGEPLEPGVALPATHGRSSSARALTGSLPVHPDPVRGSGELVPAILFAPVHLRSPAPMAAAARDPIPAVVLTRRAQALTTVAGGSDIPPVPQRFLDDAEAMLASGDAVDALQSRFRAGPADATYDFPEYVLLRNPDDPYAPGLWPGPGNSYDLPADPRFTRFVREAENGIAAFVEHASLAIFGTIPTAQLTQRMGSVRPVLLSWWFDVCAVRSFNRLGRYSRTEIMEKVRLAPEVFYGASLCNDLIVKAKPAVQAFLISGDGLPTGPLQPLLSVAFWEGIRVAIFQEYFERHNQLKMVEPTAPTREYPFEPFPSDEVLFGLRVVHRQTWRLREYGRGELVRSIPLAPRESHKASVRILQRTRTSRTTEDSSSFETSSESTSSTKDTSEVILEASRKLNAHVEAEAGVDIFTLVKAKVSAGLSLDLAASSKTTSGRVNEMMEKTASRMKRDTKVTVSTEREDTFEETRSSELTNPNDEVAVTYLYHRLQQRYWVSTQVAEVHSVVFVPEPLPEWDQIDENWVREHADILAAVLLDRACAPAIAAIRKEPPDLAYTPTNVFSNAANAGINAATAYRTYTGGRMPDMLASGQQHFERDYERRNTLLMDQARRRHQSEVLLMHIRRNILYYMRAIWASEDYDQRMQRYSRIRVPVEWQFVPRGPVPAGTPGTPLQVEGVFMPDSSSARPLSEVINTIGPIAFLFNCAVYELRDDPQLVNLHQALAYLRASYMRFAVTVTISAGAGVTFRQAVAAAPRSFSVDYTLTYRTARGKWLIPVPGRQEGDWIEVRALPDGSLDAVGLRIWLDGAPVNGATLTVRVRATADLEDPHLRLVQILHPLPAPADEPVVFTDELLREMTAMFPELGADLSQPLSWGTFTEAQRAPFRAAYHRFLMLRESGRLVTLDTANLVLDVELGDTPVLEPFKRLHRYVDVLKEYQELWRRTLDNTRREELLKKGVFGDPDIERVTLVGTRDDIKDAIALADPND